MLRPTNRRYSLALASTLCALFGAGGCSKKSSSTDTSSSGSTVSPAGGGTVTAVGSSGDDVDVSQTGPAAPTSNDVATNPQTGAQVVDDGLDSATSAAAAGAAGGGANSAALALDDTQVPTDTVTKTGLTLDCYLGSTFASRPAPGGSATLTWPESTDSSSVFSDSKNDPTTAADMYVEPALLLYPATAPTTTLTLSVPFVQASIAEVIQTDDRQDSIALNDKAQTTIATQKAYEEHRFWGAAHPFKDGASAAVTCGPLKGSGSTGSSTTANGTYARIKFGDDAQVDGLNLLQRVSATGSSTRQFLPKIKGVLSTTPVTLQAKTGNTGYRLAQWATSTTAASSVANAAYVRRKTVTSSMTVTNQVVNANDVVESDVSNAEEVRASAPLVIQEFRDASDKPLEHQVTGTINKTAKDASGDVKWFTTLAFSAVAFDLVNSSEPCIPVDGTITVTTYDKEGGTVQGSPLVITYSNTPNASGGGKIDPSVSVAGDDSNSTRAKWLMLQASRRCDFKQ
jgi:hypothetical protein